jgi:hypothetical protein
MLPKSLNLQAKLNEAEHALKKQYCGGHTGLKRQQGWVAKRSKAENTGHAGQLEACEH